MKTYMKLTSVILLLFLSISMGTLVANPTKPANAPGRYETIMSLVARMLKEQHFKPPKINDKFSVEVFYKYLYLLDKEKNILLKTDIDKLQSLSTHIDDELNGAPLDCFYGINEIIKQRETEVARLCSDILSQPFDFTAEEEIAIDVEPKDYPADENARREVWRKLLKYHALEKLTKLQDARRYGKRTDSIKVRTDAGLEAEARMQVQKQYDRYFTGLKKRQDNNYLFNTYINAITTTVDPHTNYLPPAEKLAYEEMMGRKSSGIGISLKEEDDKIMVKGIDMLGPAWKQGQLKADDIILKVAQENEAPVDVTGYPVDDVQKLMNGRKGTTVKLTVKGKDNNIKEITIIRGEMPVEKNLVESAIINGPHKIGYICLPEFYGDPMNPKGRRCSADMIREIDKLKTEHVEGIILDIRYNGGGALQEAVLTAGIFLPTDPIVQIASQNHHGIILRNEDKKVQYSGPLAILVNEYTASASEILAAAMQDHKRAVIIGSAQTFGKGTVQQILPLKDTSQAKTDSSLGALRLTQQKIYRVNGESTQLVGVASDIVLPGSHAEIGERKYSNTLIWDQCPPAKFATWSTPVKITPLIANSEKRRAVNDAFILRDMKQRALEKIKEKKTCSLNLRAYREEKNNKAAITQKYTLLNGDIKALDMVHLNSDVEKSGSDSTKLIRNRDWLMKKAKDIDLNEAVNVMNDLIVQ